MPIRMSGMVSGLDTESIVKELVKVQQGRLDKIKNKQTKLDWKTEKWQDLNKKITNFFKDSLTDMRFESSYNTKSATITNSSIGTVKALTGAVMGNHSLVVSQLATTQSWTSEKIKAADGSAATKETKLKDLVDKNGSNALSGITSGELTLNVGGVDHTIVIDKDNTTLGGLLDQFKNAGINANYDASQGRIYLASKGEGADNGFTLTAANAENNVIGTLLKSGHVEDAKNAKFSLDGVNYETATNSNTINGLKIDLTGVSEKDINEEYKPTTIRVQSNTDEVYKKIKDFIKSYNELLEEMNTLYNADAAKGYEPLTSEQKDEMSDDEIEKWENKIKDSLLRRDEYLDNVISSMRESIIGVHAKGSDGRETSEYISLGNYGIGTKNYLEKGKLHIDGDKDDDVTSGEPDKLRAALESDPDKVAKDFSTIFGKMYSAMNAILNDSNDYKSSQKFYNDKQLKDQKTNYEKEYSDMEKKIASLEDRYYKQFTRMETMMQKLQDSTGNIQGLTGGM